MIDGAVLDASAILAHFRGETGGTPMQAMLQRGRLSAVNLAEVAQRLLDFDEGGDGVAAFLQELPCRIVDFDAELAVQTACLRRATRRRGLSLGDRACLALAIREGLPVLTADQAWADLDLDVEVVLLR